jgi:hypothetical protein
MEGFWIRWYGEVSESVGGHCIDERKGQHGMKTDIKNFQDVLRKFPPRPNKEGSAVELKDVVCSDCDAIFSSR